MTRYRLIREIGGGGMGVVYEGRKVFGMGLETPVAIKVIRAHCCEDEHDLQRFAREAVTSLQINHDHPNLVTTFDFGRSKTGRPYLVMELVEGTNVGAIARVRDLSPVHIRRIARDALRALDHLHTQGVIHRDVSPGNLLLSRKGRLKLADFGLVKPTDSSNSGRFRGTAAYASPEALQGGDLSERSDLYSLAVVLYELIAGVHPYGSGAPQAVFNNMVSRDPEPLPEDTPADLQTLVMGMMAFEIQSRVFSSAREAIEFIDRQGNPVASDAELIELIDAWATTQPNISKRGSQAPMLSLDGDASGQRRWRTLVWMLIPIAFMGGLAVSGLFFDFARPADPAERSIADAPGQHAPGQHARSQPPETPETAPVAESGTAMGRPAQAEPSPAMDRPAPAGPAPVVSSGAHATKRSPPRAQSKRGSEPSRDAPGGESRPASKLFYDTPTVERTEWHIYIADDEKGE